MVDTLRQSVATLQAPSCPNCAVEMTWYRAQLIQTAPSMVEHFFQCPNCNRMIETRVEIRLGENGPGPQEQPPQAARGFCCAA